MTNINSERAQDPVNKATEAAHAFVAEKVDTSRSLIEDISENAAHAVEHAADSAHAVLDSGRDTIAAGLEKATAQVNDVGDGVTEIIKKYPVRVLLIGAACGAALGFLLGALKSR